MSNLPVSLPLSEIVEIRKGKKPNTLSDQKLGEQYLPYILIDSFDGNYKQFTADTTCVEVSKSDIEIVWDGERSGLVSIGHEGYLGSTLAAISLKNEDFSSEFIFYNLQRNQSYLRSNAEGTGVPHLSRWSIENLKVFEFSLPEQKKIAAILTSVDDVIESTQKQIDKLQDLKKATMNELLTKGIGHTEFKDSELGRIPKSWQVKALGNLLDHEKKYPMRSGPFGSALLKDELVERGVPFLGIDNVQVENFVSAFKRYITEQKFRELSKYQVFADDLIVTIMGTVGRCCIIPENIPTAISSKHTWVISFDAKKIISHLVCWQVNHAEWVLRHFADNSQGGVMSSISSETLKTTMVPVPPMAEQLKIFDVYMEFQNLIGETFKKLTHLRSLKKSLMQDLLTGKVRVKVD
ncbi:restriction endonuclease subunit S [Marivivens marinus]|uniref:restriction endonuclease subunit S n=1 Tax=Marivivens marinus TaxID=3110173 RepID=UPI003B845FF0